MDGEKYRAILEESPFQSFTDLGLGWGFDFQGNNFKHTAKAKTKNPNGQVKAQTSI